MKPIHVEFILLQVVTFVMHAQAHTLEYPKIGGRE